MTGISITRTGISNKNPTGTGILPKFQVGNGIWTPPPPLHCFRTLVEVDGTPSETPVDGTPSERAVHSQVYSYLLHENILTPKQFGFRPKLSTAIALTYFTDNILDNLDKGSIAGAVFLDLSKAFDTVSHDRLIQKLGTINGFSQPTINWFSSYLSNRFQVTYIGLEQSSTQPVHVGVPWVVYWVLYCFSLM